MWKKCCDPGPAGIARFKLISGTGLYKTTGAPILIYVTKESRR